MTYDQLFAILGRLGFSEREKSGGATQRSRIYIYEPADIVLLFRDSGQQTVSPADLLSTEMRLQSNGITDKSLESLSQLLESTQR